MANLLQSDLVEIFKDKKVVIIGSAPSGAQYNHCNDIESYDEIVRVNNYKTRGINNRGKPYDYTGSLGVRTDYHYSFYGGSIRKTPEELRADGIKGHLCKCPNDECHVTKWHEKTNQRHGGDFRPIYRRRKNFWIAPVYIPEKEHYMKLFNILEKHVPSTGFACIWEIIQCKPKQLYITGFDFMKTPVHNVDEPWLKGNPNDPIGHSWNMEAHIFKKWAFKYDFIKMDPVLRRRIDLK